MENQTVQPFEEIDDIEEDIQKFLHLSGMNCLMIVILLLRIVHSLLPYKKEATDVADKKSPERNDIIRNDFHYIYVVTTQAAVELSTT